MKRKISLLAFEAQPIQEASCHKYEKLFSEYSGSDVSFKFFSDVRTFFTALAQAIPESEELVLAIPDSQYLTIKKLLFSALKTHTDTRTEILDLLQKNGISGAEDYSVMPVSAQILLSNSGKNSGFIERRGPQTLFFLPLNNAVATEIEAQLQTFLGIVVPIATKPEDETNVEIQSTQDSPSNEQNLPSEAVKLLRERGLSVAVAPGKCSSLVFKALDGCFDNSDDYSDTIYSFDVDADKKNMSQNDYIATLAGNVRKESNAPLGISLSSVFMSPENKNEYFMILCIADETNARVFKIFSCEGESLESFINACIYRLYELLCEYAQNIGFAAQDTIAATPLPLGKESNDAYTETKPSSKKIGIIIVLAAVAALLLGLAVTFFVRAYNQNSGSRSDSPTSSSQTSTETTESQKNILGAFAGAIIDVFENTSDEDSESLSSTDALDSTDEEKSTKVESTEEISSIISEISTLTELSTLLTTTSTTTVITTRPPTTAPPTTTKEHTTAAPTTTKPSAKTGTFTFTVYGYGHGVGMSQNGAITYAKNGWDYKKILLHYYNSPNISLVKDENAPQTVSFNGKQYSLVEYLAKTTRAEMGTTANIEAFKAQVVAIYTYAKRTGFKMTSSHHAFNASYAYEGTTIHSAVEAVLGEYLSYNGSPAMTPYFSTSAGKTTSSANVWGGSYPYLQGGRTSPESNVVRTLTMTSTELKRLVEKYNASTSSSNRITLQDDPAKWITILEHDSAVNSRVGYISSMKIGNKTMKGNAFRLNIMGASTLRSHCFSYTYKPD